MTIGSQFATLRSMMLSSMTTLILMLIFVMQEERARARAGAAQAAAATKRAAAAEEEARCQREAERERDGRLLRAEVESMELRAALAVIAFSFSLDFLSWLKNRKPYYLLKLDKLCRCEEEGNYWILN